MKIGEECRRAHFQQTFTSPPMITVVILKRRRTKGSLQQEKERRLVVTVSKRRKKRKQTIWQEELVFTPPYKIHSRNVTPIAIQSLSMFY